MRLGFAPQGTTRSVLCERTHEGPMRVLRPLYPEGPSICHVAVLHPPSGIAGGDAIDLDFSVEASAHATLTTPGATRWYKANGNHARQSVRIAVAGGARFEWLPLENIFFEQADAALQTEIDVQPGARAMGWEISQLGSIAQQPHWAQGTARTHTALRHDGTLLWVEQGTVGAADAIRHRMTGLDGLPVFATLWCVGPAATHDANEALAAMMPWEPHLRAAVTTIPAGANDVLCLVRALGLHTEEVRELLVRAWMHLRRQVFQVDATPLRLWST